MADVFDGVEGGGIEFAQQRLEFHEPLAGHEGDEHVDRAARAVGVAQSLVSKELVDDFLAKVRADYSEVRERHRNRGSGKQTAWLPAAPRHPGHWI